MLKDTEAGSEECSGITSRPRRLFQRFSLRRLLYSSPLIGRRFCRSSTSGSKNAKSKDTSNKLPDIEKGEAKVNNGASNSQSHNVEFHRASSRASVLSTAGKSTENGTRECPICLNEFPIEYFPEIQSCHHRSCYDCFQEYLKMEISESRINIACPECPEPLHPHDIRMLLNDEVQFEKYEDFMVRRVLAAEPDARWCPTPDCSFALIATGCASCPKLRCERPGCDSYFCYHCKAPWHPNQTCDAARAQRSGNGQRSSSSSSGNRLLTELSRKEEVKACPRCQVLIFKLNDGSCNHMTCAVCATEFCWLCMKEISDLHYLSPSGCTFWGKKPWSRKKKVLWQLGTLVGAPVGIGLVAGIAVPAMIIGIPVWVGRKLYTRYKRINKHRRNAYIIGGVTASVLVSPVLAGLAVGIGVPILLFYVYGVVPISLFRSSGCDVSTSGSGIKLEFDEDGPFDFRNSEEDSGNRLSYLVFAEPTPSETVASTNAPSIQSIEVQVDVRSRYARTPYKIRMKTMNASIIAKEDGQQSQQSQQSSKSTMTSAEDDRSMRFKSKRRVSFAEGSKDTEMDVTVETQESLRSPNDDSNSSETIVEESESERIDVSTLRNVFFNNMSLPVIEEPSSVTSQANSIDTCIPKVEEAVEVKSDENLNC